jgi:hypothetical protein
MDPLSVLSVAAAVVQFADFGFRLVKSVHDLYKSSSGQKAEHIELSVVSQDLSRLAASVEAKFEENTGPSAQVFLSLCRECASTNDELQEILSKLEARGLPKSSWLRIVGGWRSDRLLPPATSKGWQIA